MSERNLKLLRILNPFDPLEREITDLPWTEGKTLAEYFPKHIVAMPLVLAHNGKIIPDEFRAKIIPEPGDSLVVCPIPQDGGGDGGKNPLATIAMIAVAVVAPYAAGAMGFTAGTIGYSLAVAGITLAGGMLVNAILPPKPPKRQGVTGGQSLESSPSYGIDGPKNTSAEGVPVPAIYGEFRFGGNMIATFVENSGNTQFLYMLLNMGEGPIESITDIEINEQPMSNFADVQTEVRLGDDEQAMIPWFDDTVEPHNIGQTITTSFINYNTNRADVDKFRLDIVFPQGLYGVDPHSGNNYAMTVQLLVEYKPVGAGVWTSLGTFTYTENNRSTIRRSISSPQLTPGEYDIRIRRVNEPTANQYEVDTVQITDVNEIILDDVTYPHTALLGVRIRLSDQLNGIPRITAKVKGRKIKYWDGAAWVTGWNANPAWVVLDMMTNKRFGGGMSEGRFNLDKFKELATHCTTNNLTFNGVFDVGGMTLWDATQNVLRVARAQWVNVGTRYSLMIEKEATPVQMFSVANMVKGSFKQTWLPVAERATEIDVTYFDKNDGYRERTVRVWDQQALAAGRVPKGASIVLYGVTDAEQAYKEGHLQLNLNRFVLQTVEFDAPTDAIGCTVGDLIYVQHDMPQWGYAGRLTAGSTSTLMQLDRPVPFENGSTYKFLTIFDSLQRATGTVANITGTAITLNGYDGNPSVKRIQVDGKDREVTSVFDAGGGLFGVNVVDAAGIVIGSAYTLWDTDVIEERDVTIIQFGDQKTVTLSSALPAAPAQFQHWMFGKINKVKKPFRVKYISRTHEFIRTIRALEYNASVYSGPTGVIPTPNYSDLDIAPQHVTIENVTEELILSGSMVRTRVWVHYWSDQETYRRSRVFVSKNGSGFEEITGKEFDRACVEADDGDNLLFRVVAMDVLGVSAPESTAPTRAHTVVGKTAPPSDVQNFVVTKRTTDLLLTWDAIPDLDVKGYEIRVGANWGSGEVLITNFQGTMHVHDQTQAGEYRYHIRAIDTAENYSAGTTTFALTLHAPSTVQNFTGLQSGGRIELFWDKNPETDIVGYEVREGASWSGSVLIATVQANRHTIPAGANNTRRFWIKPIAAPGIYGNTATFCDVVVEMPQNRNILVEVDEGATSFPHISHFCHHAGADIVMDSVLDLQRAEYLFDVGLGETIRAQNSISTGYEAVTPNITWEEATFAWNSPSANRPWSPAGDLAAINMSPEISLDTGLSSGETEGWRLHNNLTSVTGVVAATSTNVVYGPGRYGNGVNAGLNTVVDWTKTINGAFYKTLWIKPQPGRRHLALPGTASNNASTPDTAAVSITGDIDLRWRGSLADWTPATATRLIDKHTEAGDQRSYMLRVKTTGELELCWSENGTAELSAQSTVATGITDGSIKWVRATLDVDNGSTQREIKFYLSDDGITWSQLGATVTQAGVTSIFNSTSPLAIGHAGAETSAHKCYYAEVRSSINGAKVAVFDPYTDATEGSLILKSSATGEVWTVNQSGGSPAVIVSHEVGFWSMSDGGANYLRLGHDGTNFYLEDQAANRLQIAKSIKAGMPYFVGIIQTAGQRKLYLAEMPQNLTNTATVLSATGAFTPIASCNSVRLWAAGKTKSECVISDIILGNTDLTTAQFKDLCENGHAPGFGRFQIFIYGDYHYKNAIYRAVMISNTADRVKLNDYRVQVDVEDVRDNGIATITNASTGLVVTFTRSFLIIPTIKLTLKGGTVVAVPYYENESRTGFTVKLKDPDGNLVTGIVSWTAEGY